MYTAATQWETLGDLDFCIDIGDIVEGTSIDPQAELAEITTVVTDNYTGDMHYCFGNHEAGIWDADWTDYTNIISLPGNAISNWVTGLPAGWPDTTAYSFDVNGIHFIILCTNSGQLTVGEEAAQLTWLQTDLAATSLPVVVFSHLALHFTDNRPKYRDYANVQTELEAVAGQVCVSGHIHPIPELYSFANTINDIQYFDLRGNLIGPSDASTPDTTLNGDAAFYVFTVIPNAVKGDSRMKANVQIECYFRDTTMDKVYDTYGAF